MPPKNVQTSSLLNITLRATLASHPHPTHDCNVPEQASLLNILPTKLYPNESLLILFLKRNYAVLEASKLPSSSLKHPRIDNILFLISKLIITLPHNFLSIDIPIPRQMTSSDQNDCVR